MKQKLCILFMTGLLMFSITGISHADYMVGSSGTEVRNIQKRLNIFGFKIKTDGNYNSATKNAVKKFQKRRHIEADGIVGPVTYKALMGKEMRKNAGSISKIHKKKSVSSVGIDDSKVNWQKSGSISPKVKSITAEARKYVGVPYKFGGTTPRGFDCSGFIQYVFNKKGISLPRAADEQYTRVGRKISINSLEPGDLVFFKTYDEGISHSGLYLGDGYFISATSSRGVAVATMKNGYWHDRYIGANRVL